MIRIGMVIFVVIVGIMMVACGAAKEEKPAVEVEVTAEAQTATAVMAKVYNLDNGEAIYKKYCFACHDAGLAGAARHVDLGRWEESLAKGVDTLVMHVIDGYTGKYGIIPANGTCMECTDQDIFDAVHYQLKMGGVLN